MNIYFFIAVISSYIPSISSSVYENNSFYDDLKSRFEKLQNDPDIISRYPNINITVFYFNITQDLEHAYEDVPSNNKTIQNNCQTTKEATKCTKVNIFEAVEELPLTTKYLEITNSPVQILNQPILSNLTSLVHLKLTNNSIRYITSKFFIGLDSLRILNLSDNYIAALTKIAFRGCLKLISMDVSRNRIITLNSIPAAVEPLRNLTFLYLSGNSIRMIKQNDLSVLKHSPLKYLDFSHCMMSKIEQGSFSHLQNIEQLILKATYLNEEALSNATYNLPTVKVLDIRLLPGLRTFPTEAMMNLANTSVEFIDFSFSEFPFIPSTSFPVLSNLKKLRFDSSLISEIKDGTFDGLTSLEDLDLSSNRLSGIPSSIAVLKNLKVLILIKQKTDNFKIPEYSLSNLTSLTVLRLESTPINSLILKFAFHGLENLTYLTLYSCQIHHIEQTAFQSLTSLVFLELSYNNIFSLANDTLRGLRSLKILGLRSNDLFIGANSRPFVHTKALEKLFLQDNKLALLKPGVFSGMAQLQILNLTKNSIVPWNFSVFEGNAPLNLLVENNLISYATPAMLEDFKQANHVDVSSNPFDCRHCQTTEFREWLLSTNDSYRQDEDDTVYNCFSPPDRYGYSIFATNLQFDHCFPPLFALEIRVAIAISAVTFCAIILMAFGYYFRWYFRYWWFHIHASVKRLSTSADGNSYLYDAFVSYNSADIIWVMRTLIPNLENRNSQIRLCLHDRDFEVGRLITENILESIDKSRKVLLVLTNSFAKSEWCLFELHVAQHRLFHDTRDALVLVQAEPLQKDEVSKHLKYLMKTRTLLVWPNIPEKQEAFWINLHKILSS